MRILNWFKRKDSVYVVVANEREKVKACIVFSKVDDAMACYGRLGQIYGAANVAMCSRYVDTDKGFVLAGKAPDESKE